MDDMDEFLQAVEELIQTLANGRQWAAWQAQVESAHNRHQGDVTIAGQAPQAPRVYDVEIDEPIEES